MVFSFDEKYVKILNLLQENSRTSYAHIANELGISEVAVRYRVKNLIDNGIINKFTISAPILGNKT